MILLVYGNFTKLMYEEDIAKLDSRLKCRGLTFDIQLVLNNMFNQMKGVSLQFDEFYNTIFALATAITDLIIFTGHQ